MADLTEAKVDHIPDCQLPHPGAVSKPLAYADAKIPMVGWAYICKEHFDRYQCSLGMGRGQVLVQR
jgi:hypothetical protein